MLVDVTRYHLEMTSREQLKPGSPPPRPVEMEKIGPGSASPARSIFGRVGSPHYWLARKEMSRAEWESHLSRPEIHAWLIRVDDDVVGMVELRSDRGGDVEMITFGLVPEFVGRGFGGEALTLATELAWDARHPQGAPVHRVWLHTNSLDHPHAKPNYERRGFSVFRTEHVQREIPD